MKNQMPQKEDIFGTPIICRKCNHEDKVRLIKGTKIKQLYCPNCHSFGTMMRNTDYDKERRQKVEQ